MAVTSVFAGGCLQVYHECLDPLLEKGIHLVLDRYWYDDIVYRSFWIEEAAIRSLYQSIPAADLAIFLDIPPSLSYERNRLRADGKSPLMRDIKNVTILSERFNALAQKENMLIVDGTQELEAKHHIIFHKVLALLETDPI